MRGWAPALRTVFIAGLAALAAALAAYIVALHAGWPYRFDVGDMKINPRAKVRGDVVYELIVWDEAVPAPWAEESQTAVLERAADEFTELYPNVRVTLEVLDETTARERLADALAAGTPPDVYGSARGALWSLPRQVPASPYLPAPSRDEPPLYDAPAVDGLRAGGTVWGWPRGLWWNGWLARKDTTIDADWTYDSASARLGAASPERLTAALDYTSLNLLEQLMAFAGTPSYADGDGRPAWERTRLFEAASFLVSLQPRTSTRLDADAAARRRLERLLEGEADVVGPVNPYTVQSALRHAPGRLVVVPPPRPPGSAPAWPVWVSSYFVFHQSPYKGDDHTRLAAELARFLAAKAEEWLVQAVGLLPVTADGWRLWSDRSPWDDANRQVLLFAARNATAAPPWTAQADVEAVRAALLPRWRAFVAGEATPERFTDDVMRAVESVLSAGADAR